MTRLGLEGNAETHEKTSHLREDGVGVWGINRGTDGQSMGQNAESLAEVAQVWEELPEALRTGILAMVRAAMVKA